LRGIFVKIKLFTTSFMHSFASKLFFNNIEIIPDGKYHFAFDDEVIHKYEHRM
jgi:hypothetical protein